MAEVGLADLITAINQAMLDAQTAVTRFVSGRILELFQTGE